MKNTLSILALLWVQFTAGLCGEPTHTPNKHYALGHIEDAGWPKGALAFEHANKFKGIKVLNDVDLAKLMIPYDDQGPWGRCTGFGTRRAYAAAVIKMGKPYKDLSSNYPYYKGREMEGTTKQDAGAMIGDVVKGWSAYGSPAYNLCPDTDSIFRKPTAAADRDAQNHQVTHFYKINNVGVEDVLAALSAGYVVVFGMKLNESFEFLGRFNSYYTGKGSFIGRHCMVFYKFSKTDNKIWGWNQWGNAWGNRSTFSMPITMMESDVVSDCYIFDIVEG